MINEMFSDLINRFNSKSFKSQSVFFNLWSDSDDQLNVEFSFPILSHEFLLLLFKIVNPDGEFHLVSDVSSDSKPQLLTHEVEKSIESFMLFQRSEFTKTDLLTKLYIFDDSLDWYILVDESVLLVMSEAVFKRFIIEAGGREAILKRMQKDLESTSGYAKSWRNQIIDDFKRSTGL